ncbi:hypothetical protein CDD80_5558 [Ophiocordyceps camponoti-rufipedis]|uniref:Uncharacterized protein n=1 Tax=Ophiocordyceps camponoti-rufipedis TaxID=2004952 RepID=A0A2C5YQL0_9HYPO|nr:hypothetical protein CDD80_5558 [Ophiocordyceps camponoti-rufipedis]
MVRSENPLVGNRSTAETTMAPPPPPPPSSSSSSSRFLRRPSFPSFGKVKAGKGLVAASSSTTHLVGEQQMVPPVVEPQQARRSKLPRSRTMNVLNDLKKSISRSSLTARSAEPSKPNIVVSTQQEREYPAESTPRRPEPPASPDDIRRVTTAQPLQYWTGRFSRLNDVHLGSNRGPESLLALRSGLASQKRNIDPQSITEDDARHLHVLAQLHSLCATPQARQSLHDFQLVLSHRLDRPILKPEPEAPPNNPEPQQQDRGLVARFFGSRPQTQPPPPSPRPSRSSRGPSSAHAAAVEFRIVGSIALPVRRGRAVDDALATGAASVSRLDSDHDLT